MSRWQKFEICHRKRKAKGADVFFSNALRSSYDLAMLSGDFLLEFC